MVPHRRDGFQYVSPRVKTSNLGPSALRGSIPWVLGWFFRGTPGGSGGSLVLLNLFHQPYGTDLACLCIRRYPVDELELTILSVPCTGVATVRALIQVPPQVGAGSLSFCGFSLFGRFPWVPGRRSYPPGPI